MEFANQIELEIVGDYALFSDPLVSISGEKLSYPVPTREALKGILKAVYWKPSIIWFPDEVRVMNPISYANTGVRGLRWNSDVCSISEHTVLANVRYRLRAHFEWNENRTEFAADRNEHRHYFGAKRMLQRGGAMPAFLGVKRYPAEITPCDFSADSGFYDNDGSRDFGFMHCGFIYPDEGFDALTRSGLSASYFRCVMEDGIIRFPRPEECVNRFIKPMQGKAFEVKQFELV